MQHRRVLHVTPVRTSNWQWANIIIERTLEIRSVGLHSECIRKVKRHATALSVIFILLDVLFDVCCEHYHLRKHNHTNKTLTTSGFQCTTDNVWISCLVTHYSWYSQIGLFSAGRVHRKIYDLVSQLLLESLAIFLLSTWLFAVETARISHQFMSLCDLWTVLSPNGLAIYMGICVWMHTVFWTIMYTGIFSAAHKYPLSASITHMSCREHECVIHSVTINKFHVTKYCLGKFETTTIELTRQILQTLLKSGSL